MPSCHVAANALSLRDITPRPEAVGSRDAVIHRRCWRTRPVSPRAASPQLLALRHWRSPTVAFGIAFSFGLRGRGAPSAEAPTRGYSWVSVTAGSAGSGAGRIHGAKILHAVSGGPALLCPPLLGAAGTGSWPQGCVLWCPPCTPHPPPSKQLLLNWEQWVLLGGGLAELLGCQGHSCGEGGGGLVYKAASTSRGLKNKNNN